MSRPIWHSPSPNRSSRSPAPWRSGSSRRSSIRTGWWRRSALPEGGYHGEYIREIGERYLARHPEDPEGADLDAVRRFAVQALRDEQDRDLQSLGVKFDVYVLESSLYATSKVESTLRRLVAAGFAHREGDRRWFNSFHFACDKGRVMRKPVLTARGFTYFCAWLGHD